MRLLHVDTLELHEFFDDKIPRYTILSHRWEQDEISYKDVRKQRNLSSQGWQKVQNFCRLVQREKPDLKYAWIDTCCIDKRSSAELSEAINSMYKWYRDAKVCFAYLSDVDRYSSDSAGQESFRKSVWFTRGWTLQELIAPFQVYFVASNWLTIIGTRDELAGLIADVTRIDELLLKLTIISRLRDYSIAQKMSWAAVRVRSREEDHAYCLMGLFDVNMPLLYGEGGQKAFIRLQTEILKISDDESIFAWAFDGPPGKFIPTGLLARSPWQFRHANNIIRHDFTTRSDYVMTNKGLKFKAILGKKSHCMYFALNCCEQASVREKKPYMVFIVKLDDRYLRCFFPDEERIEQGKEFNFVARLLTGRPQTFYITGF